MDDRDAQPYRQVYVFYVQEVGRIFANSSYYTEREHLNSYLILYTVKGQGTLRYHNQEYTLSPGQAFFIDCREYQYYRTQSEQQWELLFVHFHGGSSQSYYDLFNKQRIPVVSLPSDSEIPACLETLIALQQQPDIHSELLSSKWLVHILSEMVMEKHSMEDTVQPGIMPEFIKKCINLLEKNYSSRISLSDLASACAISKFHLAKSFKRYTGMTPYDYLFRIRINAAKELLQYSDLPVSEISACVGIEHVSHFIRLFKNREGTTPLAYRREWQKLY